MKRFTTATLAIFGMAILFGQSAYATARTWNSLGTDWNTAANWTGGAPTVANAVGIFNTVESVQPNLSASVSIAGIYFSGTGSSGYDITNTGGAAFTLNGTASTGAGGTANGSAAAIRSEITSGTNTIDVSVNLGAAAAATQVFYQEAGGTLVVNGVVSSTNAVTLSLKGTGTIELNGANTFTSGSNINDAGTTLVIGNDSALGTGTFSMGSSGTLLAGGGARTLANAVVLGGNTTISGGNAFTFNGSFTSSGSNTRTLTVNNTGGVTLAGNVFLSESDSVARSLTINGSSAVTISGVVANNSVGNTLASPLKYSGTSTLTLGNTNTYSGLTSITVAGGAITATKDGALGSGNVNLATTASVTLTLQGGATNNYISDFANLTLITGNTVNLNFSGTADTIGQLIVDGLSRSAGLYGAVGSGAPNELPELFGTGRLNVTGIPEPATTVLIGLGLLIGAQRLRRKTT